MIGKKKLKLSDAMSSSRIPKVEDFLKKEISQLISAQVEEKKKKAAAFRDQKSGRSRQDDIAKAQAEAAQNIQAHGDLGYHA